jgi:hypothetical protein
MRAVRRQAHGREAARPARCTVTRSSPLLAPAAALFGVGWGANQFAPMLLVYETHLRLGSGALTAMFGCYALGLIPGLLLGGPQSDRYGRRSIVLPAAAASLVASGILMLGEQTTAALFAGRLLAGFASGAVFSAGTTWLRESYLARGEGSKSARHAAIAMTAGFGMGPLAAGAVAEWLPLPTVLPYVPHLALMIPVLALLWRAESAVRMDLAAPAAPRPWLQIVKRPRFRGVVLPLAPWVFAAPTIAFALLPSVVGIAHRPNGVLLAALVAALTLLAGVVVQPFARRLDGAAGSATAVSGLCLLASGLGLAAVTSASRHAGLLVLSGIVLGMAYGLCLVAGLTEVQRLAGASELARVTSFYYALTYVGFAAPYLLASARVIGGYSVLFTASAVLALATAVLVAVQSSRHPRGLDREARAA